MAFELPIPFRASLDFISHRWGVPESIAADTFSQFTSEGLKVSVLFDGWACPVDGGFIKNENGYVFGFKPSDYKGVFNYKTLMWEFDVSEYPQIEQDSIEEREYYSRLGFPQYYYDRAVRVVRSEPFVKNGVNGLLVRVIKLFIQPPVVCGSSIDFDKNIHECVILGSDNKEFLPHEDEYYGVKPTFYPLSELFVFADDLRTFEQGSMGIDHGLNDDCEPIFISEENNIMDGGCLATIEELFTSPPSKRQNDFYLVMASVFQGFLDHKQRLPMRSESWLYFLSNFPLDAGISLNSTKSAVIFNGKEIDREAFMKRWDRYTK